MQELASSKSPSEGNCCELEEMYEIKSTLVHGAVKSQIFRIEPFVGKERKWGNSERESHRPPSSASGSAGLKFNPLPGNVAAVQAAESCIGCSDIIKLDELMVVLVRRFSDLEFSWGSSKKN